MKFNTEEVFFFFKQINSALELDLKRKCSSVVSVKPESAIQMGVRNFKPSFFGGQKKKKKSISNTDLMHG